jgi:ribosome maturation factor RimP
VESSEIEERIRGIAERVATEHGLEMVHAEVGVLGRNAAVRVFIDKPGGVTHADCSTVSHHIGTLLDVEDYINSTYTLEVSSPGLERGLYKLADYERFAGHLAKMKAREPVNGQRNFKGRIRGVEGETVVFDDKTSGEVRVPLKVIAKANLEIDVEEEFRLAAEREKAAKQDGGSNN